MIRYIIVSLLSGILFGTMDGAINANSLAQKMFLVYKPIMKSSVNISAGIVIDIFYGFAMAGIFLILYNSLPGENGLVKGMSFAVIAWFFRVLMYAVSQWMLFNVSYMALLYMIVTGFIEMLVLGLFYGLALK